MFDSAILVLLYGCEINASITLRSFKESELKFDDCKLVIWNNGPNLLREVDVTAFESLGFAVDVIQTIENNSLAKIYNTFIETNKAKRFVILDHDSNLNERYFAELNVVDTDNIGIPIIYNNGIQVDPHLNNEVFTEPKTLENQDKLLSIGSGLVVGSFIASEMQRELTSIFDPRYFLYGVDSTFFLRLKNCKLNQSVRLIHGFEHSLSRLENESFSVKRFRRMERACDQALTVRYYHGILSGGYRVLRIVLTCFKRKLFNQEQIIDLNFFIRALFSGKHYRNDY